MAGAAPVVEKIQFNIDLDCTLTMRHTTGSDGRALRTDDALNDIRVGKLSLIPPEAIRFLRLALQESHHVAIASFADNSDANEEEGILGGAAYIRQLLLASGLELEYLEQIVIEAFRPRGKAANNKNAHLAKINECLGSQHYKARYLIDDEDRNRLALPEDIIGIDPAPIIDGNVMTDRSIFWTQMITNFFPTLAAPSLPLPDTFEKQVSPRKFSTTSVETISTEAALLSVDSDLLRPPLNSFAFAKRLRPEETAGSDSKRHRTSEEVDPDPVNGFSGLALELPSFSGKFS